ncbi:hypothetical protein Xmau_02898 [Xenorhabdus mauleonii]|uniref:Uncharacterized protein n=1 Tax=Xenorhabdus mauleonii TaxID=351675 RepID=A0A1I3WMF0_9GAMM|nr:hypothetical protein [Xenorhabdus mauleonii]PHM39294.1 hypothetical protein Xmau_02898 [Xenorhabdus mauleonii]SFK08652.1 hypothetical protein SAMN05421680_12815 [Xenorhabdus mauleonii]
MSLETSLQQNNVFLEQQNTLITQQNALMTQLISALANNAVTHSLDTEVTINSSLLAEPVEQPYKKVKTATKKKADNTPVDIEALDLETIVALAVLFKNEAYKLTVDKLAQARTIIEGIGEEERNGQADAMYCALSGIQEVAPLKKTTVLDLCLEMVENWDDIPGITERREFALDLLNEGKTSEPEPEPEPEVDPQTLFAQAEQLILQLAKGGYRKEAVDIIKQCGGNKRLGEVPLDNLSEVIRLAETTLEG